MTTFLLIHGGCHRSWCFDPLLPYLEERGFRADAIDLPYDDPQISLAELGQAAEAAVSAVDDDIIVVGHSMGGHVAPLAVNAPNVFGLVMLCAVVPEPGISGLKLNADPENAPYVVPPDAVELDPAARMSFRSAEVLGELLYNDCDDATVSWAWERLNALATPINVDSCPLREWPDVPTVSIICTDDRIVAPAWSRRAAARIGAITIELPGSHSPFASRPRELAEALEAAADFIANRQSARTD